MPLPAESCADAISPDVACSSTWLIGERIRTVGFTGLCACDCETEFRSYTTIGTTIQDPLGDSLIITMLALGSVRTTGSGALQVVSTHLAQYRMELRDNGWPTIEAVTEVTAPEWSVINVLSKHSQSHGETMYRSLVDAIQRRTLFTPALHPHIIGESIRISPLAPLNPQATQVGWAVQVDVPLRL